MKKLVLAVFLLLILSLANASHHCQEFIGYDCLVVCTDYYIFFSTARGHEKCCILHALSRTHKNKRNNRVGGAAARSILQPRALVLSVAKKSYC